MRLKKCVASNFASYPSIEFSFDGLGLTLVSGAVGSGKSTLCDLTPWILYGITSKGGSVEDVRPWNCKEPTTGSIEVDLPDGEITVVRVRGTQSQNDLYWLEASAPDTPKRGKDAADTQKLLSARLGAYDDLFIQGSQFQQFNLADAFFTAKAKERRGVLEMIADVSTAVKLAEETSEARKVAKKELDALESSLAKETGRQEQLLSQKASAEQASEGWERQQVQQRAEAKAKAECFDAEKDKSIAAKAAEMESLAAKIQDPAVFEQETIRIRQEQEKLSKVHVKLQKQLAKVAELKANLLVAEREYRKQESQPDTCTECGRAGANPHREEHLAEAKAAIGTQTAALGAANKELATLQEAVKGEYSLTKALVDVQRAAADNSRLHERLEGLERALVAEDATLNPYLDRLEHLKTSKNPYGSQVAEVTKAIAALNKTVKDMEAARDEKEHLVASLNTNYDLSFKLRGQLLLKAVKELETGTNHYLDKHFESCLRAAFTLDGDKLEVALQCRGNDCKFLQLSGGQRRILTLAFTASLMERAASTAGVDFSLVVFDEPFGGRLEGDEIQQAYNFFQEMAMKHESVLVVEHSSEFKNLFDNQFKVNLVGDESQIEVEREGMQEVA